jgi:hypothetical protein
MMTPPTYGSTSTSFNSRIDPTRADPHGGKTTPRSGNVVPTKDPSQDPSNSGFFGQAQQAAGNVAPTKPDPLAADKAAEQQKIDDFYNLSKQAGQDLRNVTANPDDINRYFKEADAPIQSQFYDQAGQVAAYLARQGMGSSAGVNVAASQQLSNNKAALESQARLQATNKALELNRQKILDQFSVNAMGLQPGLQKYGIDTNATLAQLTLQAQMQMFKEQMDAQSSAGWGNLIGQLGGAGIMALALM